MAQSIVTLSLMSCVPEMQAAGSFADPPPAQKVVVNLWEQSYSLPWHLGAWILLTH